MACKMTSITYLHRAHSGFMRHKYVYNKWKPTQTVDDHNHIGTVNQL